MFPTFRTDKAFLSDPTTACCRLRITGLSEEVTPDDLDIIFSKYGKVVGMYVTPGFHYTFLQMETEEQAINAAKAMAHGFFVRNTYLEARRVDLNRKKRKNQKQKPEDGTQEVRKLVQHLGVWKQCHDELTGYSYYWNTETDEVTWQAPASFKPASKKDASTPKDPLQHPQKAKPNLYVPPKTPAQPPGSVKIYSIGECSQQTYKTSDSGGASNASNKKKKKTTKTAKDKESVLKKFLGRDSESEDEKIELITSYGGDTDSETEETPPKKKKHDPQESDHNEDDEDDLDILSQIKRAQALKNISDSKKTDIGDSKKPTTVVKENSLDKPSKNVPGLKLVAGYSDSEEEDEPNESVVVSKPTFAKPESHSTLFPITEPIDIKDFGFIKTEPEENPPTQDDVIDAKAFQRKKRIGVALVNTGKRKEDVVVGDGERKGLGFSTTGDSQPSQPSSNIYPGFAKGGVMFIKTEVLDPSLPTEPAADKVEKNNQDEVVNKKEVEAMYKTLKEKLEFLNVGARAVSPIHNMIIQSEILFNAMKEGGLKLSYLQKWLQNTCSELVNLEKEATPEGWLLQWDRKNKRYYYENLVTGVSQWEYPVEQALPPQLPANKPQSPPPPPPPPSDDDAMDICTTPPPPGDLQEVATASPPPPPPPPEPPVISCPSPPPPPIISKLKQGGDKGQIPLPAVPPPPPPDTPYPGEILVHKKDLIEQLQPLPPGVDIPPPPPEPPEPPKEVQPPGDPLKSALNSFYSDIAALGSEPTPPPSTDEKPAENLNSDQAPEGVKKKKKSKVKLAAGITLKKKGVTQLVEKWNTLQNNYD